MVKLTLVPPAVAPQEVIDVVNRSVAEGKQVITEITEIKLRKAATAGAEAKTGHGAGGKRCQHRSAQGGLMSRHIFNAIAGDRKVTVTIGYDRPLLGFHLMMQQVYDDPTIASLQSDDYVYSNMDDQALADQAGASAIASSPMTRLVNRWSAAVRPTGLQLSELDAVYLYMRT